MPQNPEVPNRSNKPSAFTNQGYPRQYPVPPNQYGLQVNSNTFQFQGNSQSMYEAYSAQNMGPGTSDKAIRYGEPWLKQSLTFSVTNQPLPAAQHNPVIQMFNRKVKCLVQNFVMVFVISVLIKASVG